MKKLFIILITVLSASPCFGWGVFPLLSNPTTAAEGFTCSSTPSLDTGVANTSGTAIGSVSGTYYVGQTINSAQSSFNVCKVAFYARYIAGDISGKTFTAYVYSMSGTSLNAVQGTSNTVSGSGISASTWVEFTFDTPVSLDATDAIVVSMNELDGTNNLSLGYGTSDYDSGYGYWARWETTKVLANSNVANDFAYKIYEPE